MDKLDLKALVQSNGYVVLVLVLVCIHPVPEHDTLVLRHRPNDCSTRAYGQPRSVTAQGGILPPGLTLHRNLSQRVVV